MDTKISSKEDLVGSYYKCPWCKKKLIVTSEGIVHSKDKHAINYSLEDIFELHEWEVKWRRKMYRIMFNLD